LRALIYLNFFGHIDTPTNQISSTGTHEVHAQPHKYKIRFFITKRRNICRRIILHVEV